MVLWIAWWKMVRQLRPAFSRETTFLWFALCLVGLTIRPDLRGVTSIIRALDSYMFKSENLSLTLFKRPKGQWYLE